ncbi:MAG TPA: hypothetical protein VD973_20490 [Symbiobacteriaceae bacterium]|nr:hypothetical protein [Symbiobacteriaceae bacterium]
MRRWMGVLALAFLLGGCAAGKTTEQGKLIDPPPAVACGTEERRHMTGINEDARKCMLTNFASGTPAQFVTSILTEEGDPIFYTVRVMAKDRVEVDVDTTKDKFGEQKVTHYVCKTLANRILPNERHYQVLEATGCKGGPNAEITF